MHQDHALRWNQVSAHLKYIPKNKALTPPRSDLFPRNLPTQGKSLNHFARVFHTTICEFSTTERAKYKATYDQRREGKIVSDAFVRGNESWGEVFSAKSKTGVYPYSRENLSFDADAQMMECWITQAGGNANPPREEIRYDTSQAFLGETVKAMLSANEMDTLLMLAQHPDVPILDLHHLSWGHSFGFNYVCETALQSYLFFNIASACLGEKAQDTIKELGSYKSTIQQTTTTGDYDAHCFPHRVFFGLEHGWTDVAEISKLEVGGAELQEYLRMCFALLVRYDVLMRECGVDVKWQEEVTRMIWRLWRVPVKENEDYSTQGTADHSDVWFLEAEEEPAE